MNDVTIETTDNDTLIEEILNSFGKSITFSNGCTLSLTKGCIEGSTPYAGRWACNDENCLDAILEWLGFWDAPRDESGYLMDLN